MHLFPANPCTRAQRGVSLGRIAYVACFLTGCGGVPPTEIPPTHPVHGRVTYASGQPLSRGSIQFQSLDNRQVSIAGPIAEDGTFTVEAFVVGDRRPGAFEGRYRVTILPYDPEKPTLPTVLPEPVVIAPGDNDFDFIIEAET